MNSGSDGKWQRDSLRDGRLACPSCGQAACESLRVLFGRVTLICAICAHSWMIAERRAVMRASDACKVY